MGGTGAGVGLETGHEILCEFEVARVSVYFNAVIIYVQTVELVNGPESVYVRILFTTEPIRLPARRISYFVSPDKLFHVSIILPLRSVGY